MRKRVVVLTGAGVSAESGLQTFRDHGGLWHGYAVEDVATPEAWQRNPELVLDFYNERRRGLLEAQPNAAHLALAELEKSHEVDIVTQNIDDLHERAGSTRVLHLHGELRKSRSTARPERIYPITGGDLNLGDLCERGSQLRPHVVWFGEAVPMMDDAIQLVEKADELLIIGTSLVVYPAASLVGYAPRKCRITLIDRREPEVAMAQEINFVIKPATTGVPEVVSALCSAGSTN